MVAPTERPSSKSSLSLRLRAGLGMERYMSNLGRHVSVSTERSEEIRDQDTQQDTYMTS